MELEIQTIMQRVRSRMKAHVTKVIGRPHVVTGSGHGRIPGLRCLHLSVDDIIFLLNGEEIYRNEGIGPELPEPMFAILNFAKITMRR